MSPSAKSMKVGEKSKQRTVGLLIAIGGILLGASLIFGDGLMFPRSGIILFLVVISGVNLWGRESRGGPGGGERFLRGRVIQNISAVQGLLQRQVRVGEELIFWGGVYLPERVVTSHFLVTGGTGSGKTITLRLLMQSVFTSFERGCDRRALVYDGKQDALSVLHGMGIGVPIFTLNPFDARSVAWNMAADIRSPAAAQQLARILIPLNPRASQPYFCDAARQLLKGVVMTFIKEAGGDWTFRDVLLAMKSEERLRALFKGKADTEALLQHFGNKQTGDNVMATVVAHLEKYEIAAALWSRASRSVSLEEWAGGESVLVLGNDERLRAAIDPINQALFQRASEIVLSAEESETRRTWFFLDEVREAGNLTNLGKLLTKGRSKGACVVLGFQDIEGMRAVYGREEANEIVGLCSNKAILRTDDPETAKWASQVIGEKEAVESRVSDSASSSYSGLFQKWSSNKGTTKSTNQVVTKREVILPSQLMNLPATSVENGLSGVYITPLVGTYAVTIPGAWIASALMPASVAEKSFVSRDEVEQYLLPWSDEEKAKLKFLPTSHCDSGCSEHRLSQLAESARHYDAIKMMGEE